MRLVALALPLACAIGAASCAAPETERTEDGEPSLMRTEVGSAEEPLPRAYCEAQRDVILAACHSDATPPELKAACVAAAWIGFAGCLRVPGGS